MLLEAFNVLLDTRNPNAELKQKYILTYVVFTGSTGNESMSLIKDENPENDNNIEWIKNN